VQPLQPHQHRHIDVSYINVEGTFYYLTSILDGYSRSIVHWELPESMTEQEVEVIVQKALEKYPGVKPRIISDNGPQFIARDFQQFIRLVGNTHVRTSPYYPQSNGKLERWHGSLKRECIRPACPSSVDQARRGITAYVDRYNTVRLHSAIGYITPADKLQGLEQVIFQERDRKLEEARLRRQLARRQGPPPAEVAGCLLTGDNPPMAWAEDTALQRCNRSAVPSTKNEARAVLGPPGFLTFGIGTKASNLRGTMPRLLDRMSSLSSHQRRPDEIPVSAEPAH
jgi:hypothetical protein